MAGNWRKKIKILNFLLIKEKIIGVYKGVNNHEVIIKYILEKNLEIVVWRILQK